MNQRYLSEAESAFVTQSVLQAKGALGNDIDQDTFLLSGLKPMKGMVMKVGLFLSRLSRDGYQRYLSTSFLTVGRDGHEPFRSLSLNPSTQRLLLGKRCP